MPAKLTTAQFIRKARLVHGDLYGYYLVNYVNNYTKVKIKCYLHGYFSQEPRGHLAGYGCKLCSNEDRVKTLSQFIIDSKKIHGEKYDYSLVKYDNNATKVKIKCKLHGVFSQHATNHLQGRGCKICADLLKTRTTDQFINDARQVHGDRYNYQSVVYVNNHTNVKIYCKHHGAFQQIPQVHLNGSGCNACNTAKGEKHYLWNTNLTDEERKHRDYYCRIEVRSWRKAIYDRDNYTCQKCQQIGGQLEAHHIYKWSEYEELRFDLDNGITLCQACHRDYHREWDEIEICPSTLKVYMRT